MVKCENCGKDSSKDAKFCSNCGAPLGKAIEEEITVSSEDVVSKVKEILHEGNVIKIIVKDEKGKLLLEIPAWVGIVGTLLAPWLAALGAIAAIATKCNITVVKKQ